MSQGAPGSPASFTPATESGRAAPTVAVLVPAAGIGARMGGVRKPFMELGGRPVLDWALAPFLARRDVVEVVVALGGGSGSAALSRLDERIRVVKGGGSRFESVANALDGVESPASVIAVHDGARPFPPADAIEACVRVAAAGEGAVAGVRAVDTVKRTGPGNRDVVVETPPRESLWYAQTPQVFPREVFARAVAHCRTSGLIPTDDASMVEPLGVEVHMIMASTSNLKITCPEDVVIAEAYLTEQLV
ncbi:MAG: 2-C-methyl-D-erythritol 4-phosphate cytidylyltransferase [Gemmatimonadetes bacterium]|nr:2-C-methyl-D-erythritol 4-phosphate cytidylyltransferase [Gemmatimonadota bacterium]